MKKHHALSALLSFASCAAFPLAATACVTINSGCSVMWSGSQSDKVERTAKIADGKRLVVESRNGRITAIHDASATEMTITAQIRCGAPTQEEADARVKEAALVATKDPDGTVHVKVTFPALKSGAATAGSDSASIEVKAADLSGIELSSSNGQLQSTGFACPLKARTSNGAIKVDGNAGPVTLETSNGAIDATGIGTPADIQTSNGGVEVEIAAGQAGNVGIQTSNGRVKLTMPANWDGRVEAHTSNGKVSFEGAKNAKSSSVTRGDGTMELGSGAKATAKVSSSNGGITVKVSDGSSAAGTTPTAAANAPAAAPSAGSAH